MVAAIPMLFCSVVVSLHRKDRDVLRRLHASMLIGTALAWVALPHSVFDFRDFNLQPIPTELVSCRVMAFVGFPIQQICAHGGGGWRLGHHLLSDRMVHAGNCALIAMLAWMVVGFVPRRLWARLHLVSWLVFLPCCGYGCLSMIRWWD